jgi:hypothetical protein
VLEEEEEEAGVYVEGDAMAPEAEAVKLSSHQQGHIAWSNATAADTIGACLFCEAEPNPAICSFTKPEITVKTWPVCDELCEYSSCEDIANMIGLHFKAEFGISSKMMPVYVRRFVYPLCYGCHSSKDFTYPCATNAVDFQQGSGSEDDDSEIAFADDDYVSDNALYINPLHKPEAGVLSLMPKAAEEDEAAEASGGDGGSDVADAPPADKSPYYDDDLPPATDDDVLQNPFFTLPKHTPETAEVTTTAAGDNADTTDVPAPGVDVDDGAARPVGAEFVYNPVATIAAGGDLTELAAPSADGYYTDAVDGVEEVGVQEVGAPVVGAPVVAAPGESGVGDGSLPPGPNGYDSGELPSPFGNGGGSSGLVDLPAADVVGDHDADSGGDAGGDIGGDADGGGGGDGDGEADANDWMSLALGDDDGGGDGGVGAQSEQDEQFAPPPSDGVVDALDTIVGQFDSLPEGEKALVEQSLTGISQAAVVAPPADEEAIVADHLVV